MRFQLLAVAGLVGSFRHFLGWVRTRGATAGF